MIKITNNIFLAIFIFIILSILFVYNLQNRSKSLISTTSDQQTIQETTLSKFWKPSSNLFVFQTPKDWIVKQLDAEGRSIVVINSPSENGMSENSSNLIIEFGEPQRRMQIVREKIKIGNINGEKWEKGDVHYLFVSGLTSNKKLPIEIQINYSTQDPESETIKNIVESLNFNPNTTILNQSNIIP